MKKHMRKSGFYNYLLVITLYCRKPAGGSGRKPQHKTI